MALEKTSGRGVSNSYGARTTQPSKQNNFKSNISNKLRGVPFRANQFVNTFPTQRAVPYDRTGTQEYTSSSLSGGTTVEVDLDRTDCTNGLPMLKMTIPTAVTAAQGINYYDMTPWQMEEEDVWLVSVYFPIDPPAGLNIEIMVTDATSISGVNYRIFRWTSNSGIVARGYNILKCLQVEELVGTTTYGTVGTNINFAWANTGSQTNYTQSRSIRMRAYISPNAIGADTLVYFGAIHTAPAGWSKGAVLWAADDVPVSFYNLAIPVLEDYNWKCTLNATSGYAGEPSTSYISLTQYRELIASGHEVWGHTRLHDNLDTSTLADKTTSLNAARDFWNAQGIPSAARFMAYPQGGYDEETIALLPTLGYKLATTVTGQVNCPWVAGINPYTINRFSSERSNSWQVDTLLNGAIKRGEMVAFYQHTPVEGGETSNTYPGSTSFYMDHFKRWCRLVQASEAQGKVISGLTHIEYYNYCGIDPYVDEFTD